MPIRKKNSIKKVIKELINSNADSVITIKQATLPIEMACKIENGKLIHYSNGTFTFPCRQDYPKAYFHSGAIYAIKRSTLMNEKSKGDSADYFLGKSIKGYLIDEYQYNIEIDDQNDVMICELFLNHELNRNNLK